MTLNLDKVKAWGELDDWLRCPACGSYDCKIQQDPDTIYMFCNECDHYAEAPLSVYR